MSQIVKLQDLTREERGLTLKTLMWFIQYFRWDLLVLQLERPW